MTSKHTTVWIVFVTVVLSGSLVTVTNASTWYVKNDGTGDASTIEAAIDSSVFGDTVLVGPGTFELGRAIWPKEGVVITSECGAADQRPGLDVLESRLQPISRAAGSAWGELGLKRDGNYLTVC